jgi:hypothetical protein
MVLLNLLKRIRRDPKMNRISNVLLSAAVAITGFSATARTMTKPRVETGRGLPVEVRPTARTSPAENIVREGTPASVEQLRAGQLRDEKGQFCSKSDYANRVSADTKVSPGEALTLLEGGYIRMGTCGVAEGGLLGYSADARETLLLAAIDVSKEYGFRPVSSLNSTELARLDQVWAQGLASAKNRNGGSKFTVATEIITAQKIKNDCNLRN